MGSNGEADPDSDHVRRDYQDQAQRLWQALGAGDAAAAWRFKWRHPRFRGQPLTAVRADDLAQADAELVVAVEHGLGSWQELMEFADRVGRENAVARFERAADAVVTGDLAALQELLAAHPELARARSRRRHRATLLHYVAANGVEEARQRTPPTAVAVATALLTAGAEPDALAELYDGQCTTLSLLVSSVHPARAGVQTQLAELLVDHGAAISGPGSVWPSALHTALVFGYLDTALALARRSPAPLDLPAAAGLGQLAAVRQLLPAAEARHRHAALALAAQLGHAAVVAVLLDAGEDPDRFNPPGHHAHATPLHQAVAGGHLAVVRLLAQRGARLDPRDGIYDGTPLGWARHFGHTAIVAELEARGAP